MRFKLAFLLSIAACSACSADDKPVELGSHFDSGSGDLRLGQKVIVRDALILFSPDGALSLQSGDCIGAPYWLDLSDQTLDIMERTPGRKGWGLGRFFTGHVSGTVKKNDRAPAGVSIKATVADLQPIDPPACAGTEWITEDHTGS